MMTAVVEEAVRVAAEAIRMVLGEDWKQNLYSLWESVLGIS